MPTVGADNESPVEAEAVAALARAIVEGGTTWLDRLGDTHRVGWEDVLIVAPYNAQVGEIRRRLPPAARVGTVDKFQGQEAPISIYSMTTSSPELAPRGMDFLYSRHRLNVATSRARCVAILAASPDLFRVRARTPEQMRLANAFCRFEEMARASPVRAGATRSSGGDPGRRATRRRATYVTPISSRETHAARTRAQASTSSSGTCSSALCATLTSPGPKMTHGVAPTLMNICMSAPYGSPRSVGRRPVTASTVAASPTGSGWSDATRADPNRPPVISIVAGWSRRNGSAAHAAATAARSSASASAARLAKTDAVAAVGGDAVEHGRRPLPSPDDPDDGRVRQAERGHERIGLGLVPARFIRLERPAEHEQLVERRDPLAALRRMRGTTGHGQAEGDRAGMGDDDVEVRRLGDDREIAADAGPDGRQGALPAVLLGRYEDDRQRTLQTVEVARRCQRPDGGQDGRHAPLHVARAPAVQRTVADVAAPRIDRPRRGVARWHDVEVARQDESWSVAPAGPPDDDRQRRPRHLLAGPVRVPADVRERGRHDLDGEPQLAERRRGPGRDILLGAGHAPDPDQCPQVGDQPFAVHDRARAGQPRRIGRVMQVGPPEPLIPTSVAG